MRTKEEIARELISKAYDARDAKIDGLARAVASEISRLEQQIEELKKDKLDKPSARDIAIAKALEGEQIIEVDENGKVSEETGKVIAPVLGNQQ